MRYAFLALLLAPIAAQAQDLPPGLEGARLLPGWTNAQGNRIAALELVLKPGWKTYWRSPGDSGIPPSFDWEGSSNIVEVRPHWPAPELIESGGSRSFGFHDRLVLPFEIAPADKDQPVDLMAIVDFGLCERICVPAHVALTTGPAGALPDPEIEAALQSQPMVREALPACAVADIDDGIKLDLTLTEADWAHAVAIELPERPDIWVETPELVAAGDVKIASADMVPPDGMPFDLDPSEVLITLIGDQRAEQMQGCDANG